MKLGKLPARPGAIKFKLNNYLGRDISVPTKAGHQSLVKTWGMLGNDEYGDCVCAGAGHETILWNAEANNNVVIDTPEALLMYHDVTGFNEDDPDTDQGTDMESAAKWRRKTGILDTNSKRHKIGAYLDIQVGNKPELKQAIYLFSAIGIGINFPASAMKQFNAGKPWTVVKGSSIEGGHYVPAVGYDAEYVYVITWGKVQKMSWDFFVEYNDESIAYLTEEFLRSGKSLEGFNYEQLQKDLASL